MSNDDDSAWKDAVRPKVVSGPTPSSVNTIKNNSGLWQPDMTLFNFENIQKASLAKLGMVTISENKNSTNHSNNLDQTGDTSDVMTQQLQQSAENAKNDSLATDNNSTVNKVDAFQSIENQDYGKLEVIIINDGSTDESYSSSELKKLNFVNWLDLDVDRKKNYKNGPANIASLRNIGISHAKGEYVAFLDDDDLWLPGKLQKQISIMEEKTININQQEQID